MIVLGQILGIAIVILGIILLVGITRYALKFDFDAPLFKTEITITTKSTKSDKSEKRH